MAQNPTRLLRRLNPYCAQALSAAASLCQSRAHAQVSIEHWLLKLLGQGEGDLTIIARRYEWDLEALWSGLIEHLDRLPRKVQIKPQLTHIAEGCDLMHFDDCPVALDGHRCACGCTLVSSMPDNWVAS